MTAPDSSGSDPLDVIDAWPVPTAAAGWLRLLPGSVDELEAGRRGPTDHVFTLASVTKPLVAHAVLIAVEEASLELDVPIPIPGGTSTSVRHLLAHASGLAPDERTPVAPMGQRRIYSNAGFELLGEVLEEATGFTVAEYLRLAVCEPLGMTNTSLIGSPAHGAFSTIDDLLRFAAELMLPTLLSPETIDEARAVQFPELEGVLPGYGKQEPNPWGLGFEVRGVKSPHWTAPGNSRHTFGHFGRAGTMFWVDPVAGMACVALADEDFGPWAQEAWPILSSRVLRINH